jgi:hypothetical protein
MEKGEQLNIKKFTWASFPQARFTKILRATTLPDRQLIMSKLSLLGAHVNKYWGGLADER